MILRVPNFKHLGEIITPNGNHEEACQAIVSKLDNTYFLCWIYSKKSTFKIAKMLKPEVRYSTDILALDRANWNEKIENRGTSQGWWDLETQKKQRSLQIKTINRYEKIQSSFLCAYILNERRQIHRENRSCSQKFRDQGKWRIEVEKYLPLMWITEKDIWERDTIREKIKICRFSRERNKAKETEILKEGKKAKWAYKKCIGRIWKERIDIR